MGIDLIKNWQERAGSWLYYQFRAKPNIRALAEKIIGRQIQDLENAVQEVLTARILDNANGSALDLWGTVFNESRAGRSDATYRVALLLAVARDNASGTPEDVIMIIGTLAAANKVILVDEYVTRGILIYLESPTIALDLAAELRDVADAVAPAGVRVVTVSERPAEYFGWNGDAASGGWGTVESSATGGAWTKIV